MVSFVKKATKSFRKWKKKSLTPNMLGNIMISMTMDQALEHRKIWLDKLKKYKRFGLDTETSGLSWVKDRLLMVNLATGPFDNPEEIRWIVPVNAWGSSVLPSDVEPLLRGTVDVPEYIGFLHNAKFDMHFLKNHDVDISAELHDTCVMGFMVDNTKANKLKIRIREEFGEHMQEFKDKFKLGGIKKLTLEDYPIDKVAPYGADDASKTLKLGNKFFSPHRPGRYHNNGFLEADDTEVSLLYDRIESKIVRVLFDMERRGIKMNKRAMIKKSIEFGDALKVLERDIYAVAGAPFNIKSWQQLMKVYENRGIHLTSTNETAMKELAEEGDPLAEKILAYREKAKIKSTYLDALSGLLDKDDRVHCSFNQHIAETGRLSASSPNLQNIPREKWMRELFIAPKGEKFIVKDYGQIELRVLAIVSEDPVMLDEFSRGVDIHRINAAMMYNKKPEDITKEERQSAKAALSFGVIYGMSPFALAAILKTTESKAEYLINYIFTKYSGVDLYMKRMQRSSMQTGFVKTFLGRRRFLPNVRSLDNKQVSYALRQIKNTPIQGGAGDMVKAAMIHCDSSSRLKKLRVKMLLQVHDELVFQVPDEHAEEANKIVTGLMENVPVMRNMPIPFKVDGGIGSNWAEAKGE